MRALHEALLPHHMLEGLLADPGRQGARHGVLATPRPRPAPSRVARRAQRALSGRVT